MTDILLIVLCALVLAHFLLTLRSNARHADALRAFSAVKEAISALRGDIESVAKRLTDISRDQELRFDRIGRLIDDNSRLTNASGQEKLDSMRRLLDEKLENMRATVDEKLTGTLNKRLGESFSLVNERLEAVYKGLGEMQQLAVGVGDLKNVLTNVKTRGIWGEVQLGALLEQIMTPSQFKRDVAVRPRSRQRVDYAVLLPGNDAGPLYLPIDAKFPIENYQKLISARQAGDAAMADAALKGLEADIRRQAADISEKYIAPPYTTDFACLFLPVEGLYAEILNIDGLCDRLQNAHRVVVTGPTTLAALLNSLQMGFRTLAIEKRSAEVWDLLGAVKSEFGRFAGVLEKTQKNLALAVNNIDDAAKRTRTIESRLRGVQELSPRAAASALDLGDGAMDETETEIDQETV